MMTTDRLTINDRPYVRPDVDYQIAFEHLWCFPGRAIFVTPKHVDNNVRQSGIILPDNTSARIRLPIATCLQAHPDTGLIPGATYIVHQKFAKRVKNIQLGRFEIPEEIGEVWMFGVTSPQRGDAHPIPPQHWVYAQVALDAPTPFWMKQPGEYPYWYQPASVEESHMGAGSVFVRKGGKLEVGGRLVLSLGSRKERSDAGLYLVNNMKARADISVVESISPRCKTAKPGMFVWYQRRALDGLGLAEDNFGTISENGIFAAVDLYGLA